MELLEYQAKQLFEQVGIPTLPSQIISDPRELKQLQIPYPVVLKSQVRTGGRGKAGGIRRAQNTIDAIAAARNIFNLAISDQYPEVLLAEVHYERTQELFLAVVLDYDLQRPVLLGSAHGGMDVTKLLANLHQVVIEEVFSPFYARHLLNQMGITGELVPALSRIIEKMYNLLVAKDLELVEINPLGINQANELMALDGKITVHDTAIRKHPDLASLGDRLATNLSAAHEDRPLYWEHDAQGGDIGILCYGVGSAALIWDLLHETKGHPACCWILGPRDQGRVFSPHELESQIKTILKQIQTQPQIKVLLLNLVADSSINQTILETLTGRTHQPQQQVVVNRAPHIDTTRSPTQAENPLPEIVVRCLPAVENTFESSLYWETNLEDAVKRAIALSKKMPLQTQILQ
ncbi:MAG: ATP-grasp domain-containing protein [Limnothrix sp.]